jgi:thiamine-phosphate pyrophosphorylase
MLIVISNPTPITTEATLINQLFDEGLSVFHLRKPDSSSQELVLLLQEINPAHYTKIALHSHHYLAKSFGIKRLHYTQASRKQLTDFNLSEQNTDYILSTSVHSINEYNELASRFDYAFISPVFDSISKTDYKAQAFDLSSKKDLAIKLIALGGVKEYNCQKAFEMGFDGVALLGSIWESDDKIKCFKNISRRLTQIDTHIFADENFLRNSAKNSA